jgi:hypothetical protein
MISLAAGDARAPGEEAGRKLMAKFGGYMKSGTAHGLSELVAYLGYKGDVGREISRDSHVRQDSFSMDLLSGHKRALALARVDEPIAASARRGKPA